MRHDLEDLAVGLYFACCGNFFDACHIIIINLVIDRAHGNHPSGTSAGDVRTINAHRCAVDFVATHPLGLAQCFIDRAGRATEIDHHALAHTTVRCLPYAHNRRRACLWIHMPHHASNRRRPDIYSYCVLRIFMHSTIIQVMLCLVQYGQKNEIIKLAIWYLGEFLLLYLQQW